MTQKELKIWCLVAILAVLTIIANFTRLPYLSQIDRAYVNRNNPADQNAINPSNLDSSELNPGSGKKDQK